MKNLIRQAIRFIGLSGIGWLMDFSVYVLLAFISEKLYFNNICSSCIGASFVFLFSTRFVFQNGGKISLKWKYCIYIMYQIILIFLISKLLAGVNAFLLESMPFDIIIRFSALISKVIVTPITMTANFFVMKNIAEK